jgi:hypothetical protein
MKQVWQTEDGATFNTKEDAEKWENDCKQRDDLEAAILNGTFLDGCDAHEVATFLLAHYNVVEK